MRLSASTTSTAEVSGSPQYHSTRLSKEMSSRASLGHSDRLLRFLILGADGATYYATKDAHFKQAYTNVEAAIKALGPAAVEVIAEVSEKGRAPKQDAAIFALALAAARGDTATRSQRRTSASRSISHVNCSVCE